MDQYFTDCGKKNLTEYFEVSSPGLFLFLKINTLGDQEIGVNISIGWAVECSLVKT